MFALSIPPWFDCGLLWNDYFERSSKPFNPTLVRLRLGRRPWPVSKARMTFNPTLVRLRPLPSN